MKTLDKKQAQPPGLHPPDNLNSVGVLIRREIEARLLVPMIEALSKEFGRERVLEVARDTIVDIARRQGTQLADNLGGGTLEHLAAALESWQAGDAMQMDILEQTDIKFSFNVRRCRYAEMYQSLGIAELGVLLSCNRDQALIEGFNPAITLSRSQTIMEGASFCDFRYELKVEN